jgi:hypothetical protein
MMNEIIKAIENTLMAFDNNDFKSFIKHLLTLRTEVFKVNPGDLDLGLVDLAQDDNCFTWVISAIDREPTELDLEAASYIAADLRDTLNNIQKS